MLSLIIPVYNNEDNLARLFTELDALAARCSDQLEVVFVTDGPTDQSRERLRSHLPTWSLPTQLIELSRNFGSFAAIAAGLSRARGNVLAVMAADLQEPPELILEFHRVLTDGGADVVFGTRTGRGDPLWSRCMSGAFWGLYRRFVMPDMPRGGVDVFACTREVRDEVLALTEANTNLIALVLWVGFRRAFVPYERRPRLEGRSGWTLGRKLRYALDSVFSFTDLPIRALLTLGTIGTAFAVIAGATVFLMWWRGRIPVLGYTPLMLAMTFFGGLTALGLGIVGQYLWLALQNARRRPAFIVQTASTFGDHRDSADRNSS